MPKRDEDESEPSYFMDGISINGVPLWEAQNESEAMAFPFTAREVHGPEIERNIEDLGPEEDDTITVSFITVDFNEEGDVIKGRHEIEFDWGEDWDIEDFWSELWEAIRELLGYSED